MEWDSHRWLDRRDDHPAGGQGIRLPSLIKASNFLEADFLEPVVELRESEQPRGQEGFILVENLFELQAIG